jgi:uncharacterized protein YabE (DUF348 family)/3D (Asp-Asp-Asp) domain-containing protein
MKLFGNRLNVYNNSNKKFLPRLLVTCVFCIGVVLCISLLTTAKNTYIIDDNGKILVYKTYSKNTPDVITNAGIHLDDNDRYYSIDHNNGTHVTINRAKDITIRHGATIKNVVAFDGTVGNLLSREGIEYPGRRFSNYSEDTPLTDHMTIVVGKIEQRTIEQENTIPFTTEYIDSDTLYTGTEETVTDGVDGLQRSTFRETYINGQLYASELLSTETIREPVTAVVACGTAPVPSDEPTETFTTTFSPVNSTDSGLNYAYALNMTATAYTTQYQSNTITASGAVAQVGIVAVDPDVIPLGTQLYITSADGSWTYGYAVAGDTGVSGYVIDLFFDYYDTCIEFGVRDAVVYVLN